MHNFMEGETEAQGVMPTVTQWRGDLTLGFPLYTQGSLAASPCQFVDEVPDPIANKGKAKAKTAVSS